MSPANACRLHSAMRQLYGPTPEELVARLGDIGEHLGASFAELARDPAPDKCEALAANLHGAARHVMRLRESLRAQRVA